MNEELKQILLESIPFEEDDKSFDSSRQGIESILELGVSTVDEMATMIVDSTVDNVVRQHMIAFLDWLDHETAIPNLIQLSKNSDESLEMRRTAIIYLSDLGQQEVFPVIADISLNDVDPDIRISAVSAFCVAPIDGAFDVLIKIIQTDSNYSVRSEAIRAISSIRGVNKKAAYELLSSIFTDNDENMIIRAYAIEGLGYLKDKRALEVVIQSLSHPVAAIRYMGAFALGKLGDKTHIALLEEMLTDSAIFEDWGTVAEAAKEAIEEING